MDLVYWQRRAGISGLDPTACGTSRYFRGILASSGFRLPLPGLPADSATDLLAKL